MSQQREDDKISSCNLLRGGLKILGYDLQYVSPFIILKNLCQSPKPNRAESLNLCSIHLYMFLCKTCPPIYRERREDKENCGKFRTNPSKISKIYVMGPGFKFVIMCVHIAAQLDWCTVLYCVGSEVF